MCGLRVERRLHHGHAFCFANVDVGDHAVVLVLRYLRALVGGIVPLVPDFTRSLERGDEVLDEFVANVLMNQQPWSRSANLALVRHDAHVRSFDSLL